MSKFKQVQELSGVQLGDVWSDQGILKKVVHINRNTDKPYPILCVYYGLSGCESAFHNECHMVSDCELVERDGQEVEQWVKEMVSNCAQCIGWDDLQCEVIATFGEHAWVTFDGEVPEAELLVNLEFLKP